MAGSDDERDADHSPALGREARMELLDDARLFDSLVEACVSRATETLVKDPALAYAVTVAVLERVLARVDTGDKDSNEEIGSIFVAQRAVIHDPVLDGLLRGSIAT